MASLVGGLREVVGSLDTLIRGRRIDLNALRDLGQKLLRRTLIDDELEQAEDKAALVALGEKLFKLLRVSTHELIYANAPCTLVTRFPCPPNEINAVPALLCS